MSEDMQFYSELSQFGEAVAWKRIDGVLGCKRFMTNKCYNAQSAQMKRNYEPFYCAHCASFRQNQLIDGDTE